jgi:hypothetical protein
LRVRLAVVFGAHEGLMRKFFKKLFGGRSADSPSPTQSLRTAIVRQERAETGRRHSDEQFGQLV